MPNDIIYGIILFVSGDGGMADALDSGSSGSNPVRVQVPFSALNLFYKPSKNKSFSMVFSLCPVQMGQAWGKLYFISYSAFPLSPTLPAANFVLCFPYNY